MEILFTLQSPLAHVRLLFLQISEHHGRNSQHQPTNQWSTRSHSTLPSPFVRRLFITHSLSLRKSFTTQSPPMHENHYSPSILSHIPPFPLLKSHSHQPPPNLRTIQLQTSKHHPSTRIIRNLNPKTLSNPTKSSQHVSHQYASTANRRSPLTQIRSQSSETGQKRPSTPQ